MRASKLDITAPIVPDFGLGGLILRTKLVDIQELFFDRGTMVPNSYELVAPFEARYHFGEREITVAFDARNGKLARLTAGTGYKGFLFERIFVGMKVLEAMKLEPLLYYSEAEEVLLCHGVEGLSIELPESDPPIELVPQMTIKAISVYPRELLYLQGQEGRW
jgi:hypothetical protein